MGPLHPLAGTGHPLRPEGSRGGKLDGTARGESGIERRTDAAQQLEDVVSQLTVAAPQPPATEQLVGVLVPPAG
jgi:hypothetical protein